MSDLRTAALRALEALEYYRSGEDYQPTPASDAITNLRAALAEPVQEPIGYLWPTGRHPEFRFTQQKRDGIDGTPVYTSPPQRKPLTEVEIVRIFETPELAGTHFQSPTLKAIAIARAIERAHGIGETK